MLVNFLYDWRHKMSYVTFNHVFKTYSQSNKTVIKDFNLSISKGEFIVIVGPSGSGKSTLLELICGFEKITSGNIQIEGQCINETLPKDRDVAMVFQSYALLPHLNTYENIEFGMKLRKLPKKQRAEKVKWAARILQLEDYLNALPKNLSGGQRQRIAIARAMVREPKLFLMDEPLSNLDAKLRESTGNEITQLHRRLKATTIYVTHDQTEALTMADRMVILNEGIIQQIGTPFEIYTQPSNLFVATFIGKPQINIFNVVYSHQQITLFNYITLNVGDRFSSLEPNEEYLLAIRAEHIKVDNDCGIAMVIQKIEYLGSEVILYLNVEGMTVTMKSYQKLDYKTGSSIRVFFDLNHAHVFNKTTHERIELNNEQN